MGEPEPMQKPIEPLMVKSAGLIPLAIPIAHSPAAPER
jgi:hypothetical protein